jgi:methyl-CpG-binding domain protein 4
MIRPGWIPPRSPYSLIQEDVFPSEWLVIVSCMMLNCTKRRQVDRVLPGFMERWPTPEVFLLASDAEVAEVCRSLGFANRRTRNLKLMTEAYLGVWDHALDLPGVGEYVARAWEIFCRGSLGLEPPRDHALVQYWRWACTAWFRGISPVKVTGFLA